jgi:hypothetical protein
MRASRANSWGFSQEFAPKKRAGKFPGKVLGRKVWLDIQA